MEGTGWHDYAGLMAVIITNNATGTSYLLHNGKLVTLQTATQNHRLPVLEVNATGFASMTTAYGTPVA
jgi:hypothetical protein